MKSKDTSGSSRPNKAELAQLVQRVKEGDREALEQLVQLTYTDTYTLAFRLTGKPEDANDVVQDAYLKAWRAIGKFRGDASFTTWLYRITANCASDLLSKRSRHRSEVLNDDDAVADLKADHDPELQAGATDERQQLLEALNRLPWKLRQVVVMHDIYDLPHVSIASRLGITETATKVRLHRARRRLREILDETSGNSNQKGNPSDAVTG